MPSAWGKGGKQLYPSCVTTLYLPTLIKYCSTHIFGDKVLHTPRRDPKALGNHNDFFGGRAARGRNEDRVGDAVRLVEGRDDDGEGGTVAPGVQHEELAGRQKPPVDIHPDQPIVGLYVCYLGINGSQKRRGNINIR